MSRTFVVQPLPLSLPEGRSELEFSLRDPGEVRSVGFMLRPRERALIDLNRDMHALARGKPPEQEFDEVLTLFVECSRTGPMRKRRFLVLATGQEIGVPGDRDVTFLGTAISQSTQRVAHVYDVTFLGTAISQSTQRVAHVYEIAPRVEDVRGLRTPKLGLVPPSEAS